MAKKKGKGKNKPKAVASNNTNSDEIRIPVNDAILKTLELCDKLDQEIRKTQANDTEVDPLLSVSNCQQLISQAQDPKHERLLSFPKRSETFSAFTEWLCENGAQFENLRFGPVNEEEDVFGVFCTRDVASDEVVMTVPRKIMMAVEDAQTEPGLLKDFITTNRLTQSMPSVALAMYILVEKCKGKDSRFSQYLDTLPTKFPGLPIYWSVKELGYLEGTSAYQLAASRYLNCVSYYTFLYRSLVMGSTLFRSLLKLEAFTFDDFRWAMAITMTRQNPVPHRSASKSPTGEGEAALPTSAGLGLIPVYDMCNHEQGEGTAAFDTTLDALTCGAKRTFKSGEEFVMHYGPRPNVELLLYAGFVMEPGTNAHDTIDFTLVVPESDPLLKVKLLLLKKLNLVQNGSKFGYFTIKASDTTLPNPPLEFSRVVVLTKPETATALSQHHETGQVGFISEDHEMRSKLYLASSLEKILEERPHESEEDIAASTGCLNLPLILASRLRKCEDELVARGIEMAVAGDQVVEVK